jgi:uncharacterized protein (TIGR03083 family)
MAMELQLQRLADSASILAGAVRTGPLDAPIAACPGWDLAELARHMGFIHRWARLAALHGQAPDTDSIEPAPNPQLLAPWIEAGAADLIAALEQLDPDQPTWHPFTVPKVARVWPRRQANETLIHAWDAVAAIDGTLTLDPAAAADNVAEYFEVIVPRIIVRSARTAPIGTIAIQCTDTGDRLVVRSSGTEVRIDPSATPDGELAGRAEDLCLALWNRRPLAGPSAGELGDQWLSFGGN